MRLPQVLPIGVALLFGSLGLGIAAESQGDQPAPKWADIAAFPSIEFYLAKGETGACGPGCNLWIAAEGKIDAGAASRLRRLLTKLGRKRPPIYFHSPGGFVGGGLELGRLLREQKLDVSVGHTVPRGCDPEKTQEKSCETLKHSGEPVDAQFDPLHTMCNSACVFVLAGGTAHHVPPWVKLGIHDVGIDPTLSRAVTREARAINHEHIEKYLREMGIDDGLARAAFAIPFESKRFLEREEVVHFGLDRAEFEESPWLYLDKPAPMLIKEYFARTDDSKVRYLDGAVTMSCTFSQSLRLALVREHAVTGISGEPGLAPSISMNNQPFYLTVQNTLQQVETHWGALSPSVLDAISDDQTLGLSANDLARYNKPASGLLLSMNGFSAAYAKWRTGCDEYRRSASTWLRDANASWLSPKPATSGNALSIGQLSLPGSSAAWPSMNVVPAGPSSANPWSTPSSAKVAGPLASPPKNCNLQAADKPEPVTGRVTGFLSADEALSRTHAVEARLGAEISPAYKSLDRVFVERETQDGHRSTMVAVPQNMTIEIGDFVEFNPRYRDQTLPCHFIPWIINRHIDSNEVAHP